MDNPIAKVLMDIMVELNAIFEEAKRTGNIELVCKSDGVIEAFRIVSMYAMKAIVAHDPDACEVCKEAGGD